MFPIHDPHYWQLLARMAVINIVPFILVFQIVRQHSRRFKGHAVDELELAGEEIKAVGVLGYFVILSIFFFSIPVLRYLDSQPGVEILLVEPDGYTVFMIGFLSFSLVVAGVYLKQRRRWAHQLLIALMYLFVGYSFFTILEYGWFSVVPVGLFSYLLFRIRKVKF